MSRLLFPLVAAAASLTLVAGTAPSSVVVTDPCGHEPVRENDEGDPEVKSDGSGLPHLDICSLEVASTTTDGAVYGIELTMVLDGDLADRRPTDQWITNFTLDGCGWATHTFHNAATDTLNPPTTQLTSFCGDDQRSAELTDVQLDGEVLRIRVTADIVTSLGGDLSDGTQLADAMGRTWVGQSSTLGPQAVYTWDTTASANALVTIETP